MSEAEASPDFPPQPSPAAPPRHIKAAPRLRHASRSRPAVASRLGQALSSDQLPYPLDPPLEDVATDIPSYDQARAQADAADHEARAERARADAAQRRIAELEERLHRPHGGS